MGDLTPPGGGRTIFTKVMEKACAPYMLCGPWGRPMDSRVMCVVTFDEVMGVSCKTTSHICISWYFPIFLLTDGSLTWMYMASFIVLVMPCASLPIIVKQSTLIGCPMAWLCWYMGEGVPEMFFQPIPMSFLTPQYTPPHIPLGCICTCRLPHFFVQLSHCLWMPLTDYRWCCFLSSDLYV